MKRIIIWAVGIFFGLPLALVFLFGPFLNNTFPPLVTLISWGVLIYWFTRRRKKSSTPQATSAYVWPGPGLYAVDVVGESYYQKNLERICGKRKTDGENKFITATLNKEDNNPVDSNAVRVDINGLQVGYLPKALAPTFRQRLQQAGHGQIQSLECNANIRGGWKRSAKDIGHYGVWLDLPVQNT